MAIQILEDFWEEQAQFATHALEVANYHKTLGVNGNQLSLELELGRNVVSLATYRQTHRVTADPFIPDEAA